MYQFLDNDEIQKELLRYVNMILPKKIAEDKEYLKKYIDEVIWSFMGNTDNLFGEILKSDSWSETEIEIIAELIMKDILQALEYANRDREKLIGCGGVDQSVIHKEKENLLREKTIGQYADMLRDVYSESFADIQMILILGFSYRDYLEGFLNEEGLQLERLEYEGDNLSRISAVTLVMNLIGEWEGIETEDYFEKDQPEMQQLHCMLRDRYFKILCSIEYETEDWNNIELVKERIVNFNNQVNNDQENVPDRTLYFPNECIKGERLWKSDPEDDMNGYLAEYLLMCVNDSVIQYSASQKVKQIQELRKSVRFVTECNSVKEMFQTVCMEVNKYKETIFMEENPA